MKQASRTKRQKKPAPTPRAIWRVRGARRPLAFAAMRDIGLELKRRGEAFGEATAKPKPKPVDPVLAALDRAPEIKALVGRLAFTAKPDEETMAWAETGAAALGPALTLYTWLGRERAVELGEAARSALRAAGWRTLGAGPTVIPARGKASGIWAAHLSLSALSAPRPTRASMAR